MYNFYLDDFYTYGNGVTSFSVENDTIHYTAEAGVSAKLYDGAGETFIADITDGYVLSDHHVDLDITATGDYGYTVQFYKDGVLVDSRAIAYSTKNINEKEVNSYNSSRDKDTMYAPYEDPTYATHASLTSEQRVGDSGYSWKHVMYTQYGNYELRSFNDLSNVKSISFKMYVDKASVRDGADVPVAAENVPALQLGIFAMSNDFVSCTLAEGQTFEYNTWVTVNVTKLKAKEERAAFILTTDANCLGTFYYMTFYIDDVYATEYFE